MLASLFPQEGELQTMREQAKAKLSSTLFIED